MLRLKPEMREVTTVFLVGVRKFRGSHAPRRYGIRWQSCRSEEVPIIRRVCRTGHDAGSSFGPLTGGRVPHGRAQDGFCCAQPFYESVKDSAFPFAAALRFPL